MGLTACKRIQAVGDALEVVVCVLVTTATKFIIHLVDMRLEHGWTSKTQFIFHVDLWGDVGQMTTYLVLYIPYS